MAWEPHSQGSDGGFTLLELLVVLAVIAVTLALVVPELGSSERTLYSAEVRSAAALLKQARRLAIVRGVETAAVLESSAAGAAQGASAAGPAALHWRGDALRLAYQDVREETWTEVERIELLFRPQGSSGGTVHFLGQGFHGRIHVDPISGRAEIAVQDEAADDTK